MAAKFACVSSEDDDALTITEFVRPLRVVATRPTRVADARFPIRRRLLCFCAPSRILENDDDDDDNDDDVFFPATKTALGATEKRDICFVLIQTRLYVYVCVRLVVTFVSFLLR